MKQRTTFRTPRELYHADTCEPLKTASEHGDLDLRAYGRGNYPGMPLPKHDLNELCTLGYWDAPVDQDWGLDWHYNEGIEICYLAAGRLPFSVGDQEHLVEPGELTITRPWQRHRVGAPNVQASHYSWLILDVGIRRPNQPWNWPDWLLLSATGLQQLTRMLKENEQPVWQVDREIGHCFERLDEAVSQDCKLVNSAKLKILINELLLLLVEMFESKMPKLDSSLSSSERTVSLFLDNLKHRLDEPWTLDSMASECGLGRTRFSSYCKKIGNLPPVEYLTRCRLAESCRLLESNTGMPITEIAFRCGFQSSQYFSKVFKERIGHSPSKHRSQPNGSN